MIGEKKGAQRVYNFACDIWSFGCLIYETLTGEIPYRSEGVESFDILDRVRTGLRPKLPQFVTDNDADNEFVSIFEMCTEPSPSKRPSALQLCRLLGDRFV